MDESSGRRLDWRQRKVCCSDIEHWLYVESFILYHGISSTSSPKMWCYASILTGLQVRSFEGWLNVTRGSKGAAPLTGGCK